MRRLFRAGDRDPRPEFQGSTFVPSSRNSVLNATSPRAAMQAFADYKELPADSPSLLRSFRRSLLHCHTECDDLTTSIRLLSMRFDYVARTWSCTPKEDTSRQPVSVSSSFSLTADEMTNRERAGARRLFDASRRVRREINSRRCNPARLMWRQILCERNGHVDIWCLNFK